MPSARTECTELSFAFGILGIKKPLELDQNQINNLFSGTLTSEKYNRFKGEFPQKKDLYSKMYNVGFELRAIYKPFKKVSNLKWLGPQPQATTTAAAKDLMVENMPISIKENSDVVHNLSPYNLFETIPSGQLKAQNSENWFLEQSPEEYQELYSFIRNKGLENLPESVKVFELTVARKDRKPIKNIIQQLDETDKQIYKQLYLDMCHQVAKSSAKIFNTNFSSSMKGHSRNAILEQIARQFFRMDAVDYILGGIDKNKGFAVMIPETTNWRSNWAITNVFAEPELDREQSRVHFTVEYKQRKNGTQYIADFHTEIRWSHGLFQTRPEAKLYKNFIWEDIAFFDTIYQINNFSRLMIIGEGSYGIVYKGRLRDKPEIIAIKEFQGNIGTEESARKRFVREVKLMAELNHPNILPVLDYDLSSKYSPWFAMPLAKSNIAEILDILNTDYPRINNIFNQVLSGISYAHQKNIIHRDIKPQNILVFPEDKIMIGDFGLGKKLEQDSPEAALTTSTDQIGTFAYTAPEQLASPCEADKRADIYALGKTLLHMLAGGEPPIYAEKIVNKIPKQYLSFIRKAIQDNPDDRYQSVDEMLNVFSEISENSIS